MKRRILDVGKVMRLPLATITGTKAQNCMRSWVADYLRLVMATAVGYDEAREIVLMALGPDFDTDYSNKENYRDSQRRRTH